jgi:D-alanyl-D-alanine-carboxypeptidase/D-alanyl-D-alanine-endopeptidase
MRTFHSRRAFDGALGLAVAFSAAALGSRAVAQPLPADSEIRAILRARVDSGVARGIVVGVVQDGRRRFIAYGTAGPGREPLDEHTIFEIGSISKTFSGVLLADAVVRGEVRVDEPVVELLPPGTVVPSLDGQQITLEELATHTSGLPRLPDNMTPASAQDPYADYGARQLYAFLAVCKLPRAPGQSVEYSNLGGGLLGYALTLRAKATDWGSLVAQRIAARLGMRETYVAVPVDARNRVSEGHDAALDSVPAWNFDVLAGAGALRSSAADMLTWLEAQLDTANGPLAQAVAMSRTPRTPANSGGTRIALGWIVGGSATHPIWWHNGGTGGFRSFAAFDPQRHAAIVVLSNSSQTVDDIGAHLFNPAMPIVMPPRPPRTTVTLGSAALDRVVGAYPLTPGMVLAITREGDSLFVQATGQPRLRLVALADNHFIALAANAELVFDISEPGAAKHVTLRQNGVMATAPRLP